MEIYQMKGIQKAIVENREKQLQLHREGERLRQVLLDSKICDHSLVDNYEWEHDNGYGRQTMIKGKRCSYCWFIDLWDRGNFIDPKDFRD